MIDLTDKLTLRAMTVDEVRELWPFRYDEDYGELEVLDLRGRASYVKAHGGTDVLVGTRGDDLLFMVPTTGAFVRELANGTVPV